MHKNKALQNMRGFYFWLDVYSPIRCGLIGEQRGLDVYSPMRRDLIGEQRGLVTFSHKLGDLQRLFSQP